MINKQKVIIVASVLFLSLFVVVFVLALSFYGRLRKENSCLQKSLVESRAQNEKNFLLQIQEELKKQGGLRNIKDRIDNRIDLLDKMLLTSHRASAESLGGETELDLLINQVTFLISLLHDVDTEVHLKEIINKHLVGLRGTIVMHWAISNTNSVNTKTVDLSPWLYLPDNAIP